MAWEYPYADLKIDPKTSDHCIRGERPPPSHQGTDESNNESRHEMFNRLPPSFSVHPCHASIPCVSLAWWSEVIALAAFSFVSIFVRSLSVAATSLGAFFLFYPDVPRAHALV